MTQHGPVDEGPPEDPVLRLRITHITSTMSAPLPAFANDYLPSHLSTAIPTGVLPHHMPVLRIFGTTPSLQKICANIHMCYPYFYVPFPMDSTDPLRPERVIKLCQRFAVSLNHAICLALRQNPTSASNKHGGGTDPKHLHVVSVMLVKGVPFYGYHIGYNYYLKVSLVNPQRIYVALEQLRKPAVLGREWQPHEAHMNHVLQFMCDFDLYGCGWLNLSGGIFRSPMPEGDPYASPPPDSGRPSIFNTLTVPMSMVYPHGTSPSKDTYAPLEVDILPNQIINRRRMKPRSLHHDFVELLRQPLDPKEKLVPAVAELWEDERRRRSAKGLSLAEEAMLPGGGMGGRNMEELGYKVAGKEMPENRGGDWKISPEYWGMIEDRMETERRKGRLTFERFTNQIASGRDGERRKYDKWIPTAFEAVSAHWPTLPGDPKSTQRSKRSRMKASSAVAQSSPIGPPNTAPLPFMSSPPDDGTHRTPIKLERDFQAKVEDDYDTAESPTGPRPPPPPFQAHDDIEPDFDSDDEDNPFHLFAMTQGSDGMGVQADVNPNLIARDTGQRQDDVNAEYEEDANERRHAQDARQRAQEGINFRATQAPKRRNGNDGEDADSENGEYDDAELDELFRQTVLPMPTTPRKGGVGQMMTPTSNGSARSGMSGASSTPGSDSMDLQTRRANREERMRREAGWGDLSTILDRSSISLSALSPRVNPYNVASAPAPHTPRHPRPPITPPSDKIPTSAVKNLFAKPRTSSPLATPTKRGVWPPPNTIVLPPSKRSVGRWTSPSPERNVKPDVNADADITPTKSGRAQVPLVISNEEPVIEEIRAPAEDDVAALFAPAQVPKEPSGRTTDTSSGETDVVPEVIPDVPEVEPPGMSPTQQNEYQPPPGEAPDGLSEDIPPDADDVAVDLDRLGRATGSAERPKKRVRMAGPIDEPDNPFSQHGPRQASQRSAVSQQSQRSLASSTSQPRSAHTDASIQTGSTTASSTVKAHTSSTAWTYRHAPPSARLVVDTMVDHGLPNVEYREPFYSNPVDVPPRAKMFAGRMFTLKGDGVHDLQEFHASDATPRTGKWLKTIRPLNVRAKYGWEYGKPPPSLGAVERWCREQDEKVLEEERKRFHLTSQLAQPTQKSKFGFKFSQKVKSADSEREAQNMSVLSLEVFSTSRHQLLPDPEKDELTAVFFCYQNDDDSLPDTTRHSGYYAGYCVVDSPQLRGGQVNLREVPVTIVDSEFELINWVIDLVKAWDPDVLAGWELHNASWGFLTARAHESFSIDLTEELSRVVGGHTGPRKDFYSATHASTFKVSGRHILNVWRICRSEINLTQYSFENVAFHLLHQRIPHYSAATLTALWKSKTPEHATRVLKYFFQRVVMYCEIIDAAEIITKNAEFARVFGVDFASVMFRGSQYKVESFMFRIAKPESFILVSPSKQQVGLQNAPFAVPLIAEPESKYYNHPIVVLDFQSLYPSVMIAYNICYSTCLGRVEKFKGTDKFGFTELKPAEGLLELLKDYLTVTPNGMIFVKPAVRKSLLAKMLAEILDTRVMVKHAMKGARGNKSLLSLLNARQLGLKLMANVTYGYTSATYSGRMPCIEVADSIVQTGRETLEKAQELIHSRPDWDAQVVYGDTDSLFVSLPGRSKEEAFKIGNDIADTVTAMNPKPVKLKFEKVYMGSVLMAKKRYVGFKYEHPDETEPGFDAKGIETIRRDGFPAQQKIEEVCLKMLFRTQDLSQVKEFCRSEWTKILQGRVSMQDFIVAKEVRLGSYSEKGVPPPGAAVAYRRILKDPRDEPQYAERVPYIVSNAEGRRLIDRARMPEEMLANRSLNIDAEYYIRNLLIPPLSRIFNLVGADVENWYDSMPRVKRAGKYDSAASGGGSALFSVQGQSRNPATARSKGKMRIDSHFRSSHCLVCGLESSTSICPACRSTPSSTAHAILSRQFMAQSRLSDIHKICASCADTPVGEKVLCDSIDCPITYARVRAEGDVEDVRVLMGEMGALDLDGGDDMAVAGMPGMRGEMEVGDW